MKIVPAILSGGVGSRLWPASRAAHPKQLLALLSDRTMLQETVLRARSSLAGIGTVGGALIVCNARHRDPIDRQMSAIDAADYTAITEPDGRNTAPAAALAALQAAETDPESILLILPADHHIPNRDAFADVVGRAVELAADGRVVTFGIVPDRPETGYGYIRSGTPVAGREGSFQVAEFVEKPPLDVAQRYVASGDYYWNGGIFAVRSDVLLDELSVHCPDILDACRTAMAAATRTERLVVPDAEAFARSPSISIDYAVMEKTDRAAVVAADMGWNDVGSWSALYDVSDKDTNGNALVGDVIAVDSTDSLARAESRLVAIVGVDNLVVIETPDAVLVTTRDKAQAVKDVVSILADKDRDEL